MECEVKYEIRVNVVLGNNRLLTSGIANNADDAQKIAVKKFIELYKLDFKKIDIMSVELCFSDIRKYVEINCERFYSSWKKTQKYDYEPIVLSTYFLKYMREVKQI